MLQLLAREILEPKIHDHFPIIAPARVGFHDEVRRPGRRGAQEDGLVLGVELHAPAGGARVAGDEEPCVARLTTSTVTSLLLTVDTTCRYCRRSPYACTPVLPPTSSRYAGLETMVLVMWSTL